MTGLSPSGSRLRSAALVVAGGVAAGALDIAYACIFWAIKAGVPARRIFQSVAAGLLGPAAFQGGRATAALGLSLHFLIAVTMSATYYTAAARFPVLRQRALRCGAGYGVLLYVVMNYVVVPLSAAARGSHDPLWITLTVAVHVLLIGMPIAWATRVARPPQRVPVTGT